MGFDCVTRCKQRSYWLLILFFITWSDMICSFWFNVSIGRQNLCQGFIQLPVQFFKLLDLHQQTADETDTQYGKYDEEADGCLAGEIFYTQFRGYGGDDFGKYLNDFFNGDVKDYDGKKKRIPPLIVVLRNR